MHKPSIEQNKNDGVNMSPAEIEKISGAKGICRGAVRMLRALGYSCALEITLRSGRRADILAISETGQIDIIEVKSSFADFQSDKKWHEYKEFCEQFYFAVDQNFPVEKIPEDAGLILCDEYSGEIIRYGKLNLLAPARRKHITLLVARTSSERLVRMLDPYSSLAS